MTTVAGYRAVRRFGNDVLYLAERYPRAGELNFRWTSRRDTAAVWPNIEPAEHAADVVGGDVEIEVP